MSLLKNHLSPTSWTDDRQAQTPLSFTAPTEEAEALKAGAALIDFTHGGVIAVAGEESESFLHGLITNQIKNVAPDQSVYAALLTPQGRFAWDFTIAASDDGYLLVTEPDRVGILVQRLQMYLLRTKAMVDNKTADRGLLGFVGPQALEKVATLFPAAADLGGAPGASLDLGDGKKLWRDPRHGEFGLRLLAPKEDLAALWDQAVAAGMTPTGFKAWEAHRIDKALPRGGAELIPEDSIPLESGFLEMNGVDFTKGCFIGQETTARTHHRGTLKRRLYRLELEGSPPALELGATITVGEGKEAGVLTSYAQTEDGKSIGLGLLRVSDAQSGEPLSVEGTPLTAEKPSWAGWE